jgi:hypothetical protein
MYNNISYELFRNRKKFNPLTLFYNNNELTYEQFKEYFLKRNVDSPNFEYYEKVKSKFLDLTKTKEKVEEIKVEEKTTKKRRSKKKKIQENENN